MPNEPTSTTELLGMMQTLSAQMQALQDRVVGLESELAAVRKAAPPAVVDEEVLAIIGGVLAAYLGFRPHIRQVRLVSSGSWKHQGRATIHASHALTR